MPRVAFLLGAGASADANIPTTLRMTDEIVRRVAEKHPWGSQAGSARLLEFIRHTIIADNARRNARDYLDVDVERLFAAAEFLSNRNDQAWSPFVARWHEGLDAFASAPTLSSSDLSHELRLFGTALESFRSSPRPNARGVSDALRRVVQKAFAGKRTQESQGIVDRTVEAMRESLVDVLSLKQDRDAAYLQPLVELASTQGSLTVGTLNYDKTVETMAALATTPCSTGIETLIAEGHLAWPDKGIKLFKLHGSVEWRLSSPAGSEGLPAAQLTTVDLGDPAQRSGAPAVLFGEGAKLQAEGPFIEILFAWAEAIENASALIIIGYSFRDDHVNEFIRRWFNRGKRRRVLLVDLLAPDRQDAPRFLTQLASIDVRLQQQARRSGGMPPAKRFTFIQGRTCAVLDRAIAEATQPMNETTPL